MSHRLHLAAPADAADLSAFAAAAFTHTFGQLHRPQDLAGFLAGWNQPDQLARQAADPDWALALVRFDDGRIAGFIKLGPVDFDLPEGHSDEGAAELHQLYVHQDAKGTGVAALLMDFALKWAKARVSILYLSVFTENFRAQRFYARYGFYDVGPNAFRVGDHIDDDRIWRLDL